METMLHQHREEDIDFQEFPAWSFIRLGTPWATTPASMQDLIEELIASESNVGPIKLQFAQTTLTSLGIPRWRAQD